MWTLTRICLLCFVHFCGHLRSLAYYVLSTFVDTCAHLLIMCCPLLWTLTRTCLLCSVHFCGHLRTLAYYALSTFVDTYAHLLIMLCPLLWTLACDVPVEPIYLMASQCRCRELSVADIYRITYGYQLYQNGIISTFLPCFVGRNSGIMEFYN